MPKAIANGMVLEYERSGPETGEPLLLIHGVGAQLTQWPAEYCDRFADHGFTIIRYDSRDVGLSTQLAHKGVPDLAAALEARARGEDPVLPYRLTDLADDAVALLDFLAIERAHILGVSLGGMVAQQLAIAHPERVASLTIVMSHSGNPNVPPADPKVLLQPIPDPRVDEQGFVTASVAALRALGSPGFPIAEDRLRAFALEPARRSYYPEGTFRLLAAGRAAPDRSEALSKLSIPTLVMHGSDDPIIPVACGRDIARLIPGSYFVEIDGFGHDLPPQLADTFASVVALNARRARGVEALDIDSRSVRAGE